MEEWEVEISETKHFYFTAIAELKYKGKFNKFISEKSNTDHFNIRNFFHVKITNPIEVTHEEYLKQNKETRINSDKFEISKDKQFYNLIPDEIFITEWNNIKHVQLEGEEVYGHFTKMPVTFKLHRVKSKIICKEGFETGNIENRDGINYIEYYRSDCSLDWKPKCQQDFPTGNREDEPLRYRLQYYNIDCSTYWGNWIPKPQPKICIQDEWTGNTRDYRGWTQREYFNSDCSKYWKNYEKIDEPEGCLPGCLGLLSYIPFLFLLILVGSFIFGSGGNPFAIGIIIAILFLIFGGRYFLGILNRFPFINKYFPIFFRWLLSLFLFLIIITALNAIFKNFHKFKSSESSTNQKESNYQPEVVPVKRSHHEIDSTIPDSTIREKIKIKIKWKSLDNKNYNGVYYLYKDDISNSGTKMNLLNGRELNYRSVYQNIYINDQTKLSYLYTMLDSIKVVNNQNKNEFAVTIVSMIQSIDYWLILQNDCNDPLNFQNKVIREILREHNCLGHVPYGLRTPIQFLSDMRGDCDTRTLTLYTILKHYNYEVSIINSEIYGHSMLGISLPLKQGAYKILNRTKYYFWETTSKGFLPGYLPYELGNMNYWNVELN